MNKRTSTHKTFGYLGSLKDRILSWYPSEWGWQGLLFLSLLVVVIADVFWRTLVTPLRETDTAHLVERARYIVSCWQGNATTCKKISYFSLLQHIPTLAFLELGVAMDDILHILALISSCFYLFLFTESWSHLYKRPQIWLLFVLLLLFSPLGHYAQSSFSEMWCAGLLMWLFCSALGKRHPIFLFLAASLIGISKETGPVLLVGLALLLVWAKGNSSWKTILIPTLLGAGFAYSANAGFNFFRVGSLSNAIYSLAYLRVPTLEQHGKFLLATWFSPQGGVLFFWPLAFVLLLGSIPASIQHPNPHRWGIFRLATPAFLSALCLLTISAGLAGWFAPFGWLAWGNRLLLPWMVPLCFLLLVDKGDYFLERYRHLPIFWKLLLVGTCMVLVIPHILVGQEARLFSTIFEPTQTCPRRPSVSEGSMAYYYACVNSYLWPEKIAFKLVIQRASWSVKTLVMCFCSLATCGLGFWLLEKKVLKQS